MTKAQWERDKKRLIKKYKENGITRCEACGSDWILSFHHLDRRSTGKAENTFEQTRLICANCHHKADNAPGYKEFNDMLRALR